VPTLVNYNSTFNYWEVTIPVNGFSGFYVHTNLFFPLPVTLNYFNGTRQGNSHLLNWKVTCNATPSATLILERSADGVNFNSIYSINATALRCNQPFDYTDANPLPGVNYYRLKMVSLDGKTDYSNIVVLTNISKGFDIFNISPNPVTNGSFNLDLFSSTAVSVEIKIMDMQGRLVERRVKNLTAGLNSISFDVNYLASGTYAISATTNKDKTRVLRFVKE
jgi:Secretion system C-terminal sorting domain